MNAVYLGVLAAYLIHAVMMHRLAGPETEGEETQLHRGMPAPLMPITLFFACQALATPAVAGILVSRAVIFVALALMLLVLLNQLRRKRLEVSGESSALMRLFYVSGGALQTVLLVMAVYFAFGEDVLDRSLLHAKWVILGLVAGHVIFGVSLLFSHRSLDSTRDIVAYVADPGPVLRYVARAPRQLFACLDISLIEELVYRVAAQTMIYVLTGNPWLAIVTTAIVFAVVHRHFFYNHVVDSIEFVLFSLVLGVLYYWTESLTLVVLIHTVRNVEIVYFDQSAERDGDNGESPGSAVHNGLAFDRGLILHGR